MSHGPSPPLRAEVEAFRQGRRPHPDPAERLLRALGLHALRTRRFRKRWSRLRPYLIVGVIGLAALLAAAVRLLRA
jgi:hypothetical protein